MEGYRTFWNLMESYGIPQNISESDRTLQNTIEGYRNWQNVPEHKPIEGCRRIQKAIEGHRTVEQPRIFLCKKVYKELTPRFKERRGTPTICLTSNQVIPPTSSPTHPPIHTPLPPAQQHTPHPTTNQSYHPILKPEWQSPLQYYQFLTPLN